MQGRFHSKTKNRVLTSLLINLEQIEAHVLTKSQEVVNEKDVEDYDNIVQTQTAKEILIMISKMT